MKRRRTSLALLALGITACASVEKADENVAIDEQAIIGGTSAATGAWPWMAQLQFGGDPPCGASLIAPTWALTAAHCLSRDVASGYTLTLRTGEVFAVARILRHPNFVADQAVTGHFDMGLVELALPVTSVAGVDFIRPAIGGDGPGTSAVAIGWGMTNHDVDHPSYPSGLQQVTLPIVPNDSCANVLPVRRTIYADELCAGFADGHAGVCYGDSGAPLMVQRASGTWEHIGVPSGVTITESGAACWSYAVFGRTSAMVDWVRQYVPDPAWLAALL